MKNFLKGIIVGFGGISPGLSGSVLLIIFGLYQKTLHAIGTLFTNFRNNVKFLIPIVSGMLIGVLAFSKVLDYLLNNHEMPTRFCFLGLILGTIPIFYKEAKKEGFSLKYYFVIAAAAAVGAWMFTVNTENFEQIVNPSVPQSVFLGVAVVATAIVPGLDPAVVLSSLGYYEVYISSLADFDVSVLAPMVIGVAGGGMVISYLMSKLFSRYYTATFSIVFGLFLSMIPNILNETCVLAFNVQSAVAIVLMIIGFAVSFYLGVIEDKGAIKNKLKNRKDY
ncbi:MAG: DUF368 domain-containing protein [Clostridiales bacterium]|nr:DUF368 domain-containing protein [Clostridiales bacterium]